MRFFIFFFLMASLVFAQAAPQDSVPDSQDTSSANKAVFADVNIFAQMPLGSVFLLWSNFDASVEIKNQITSRNFVIEPFFMQNIDREQFEQNQTLRLFEEQRNVFFKLFPDEEED